MSVETELTKIFEKIDAIFKQSLSNQFLFEASAITLRRLVIEAEAVIRNHFGPANSFSMRLMPATYVNETGYLGRSLKAVMTDAMIIIDAAINHIQRESLIESSTPTVGKKQLYIDESRIAELASLKHPNFDFSRLVQMCRELNVAHQNDCHISVILLVRAIIDHIPPIFEELSFEAFANNLPKSKKQSALHLQKSLRPMADSHLHQHVRKKEIMPTASEVNFSRDLSVVLGEVISKVATNPRRQLT